MKIMRIGIFFSIITLSFSALSHTGTTVQKLNFVRKNINKYLPEDCLLNEESINISLFGDLGGFAPFEILHNIGEKTSIFEDDSGDIHTVSFTCSKPTAKLWGKLYLSTNQSRRHFNLDRDYVYEKMRDPVSGLTFFIYTNKRRLETLELIKFD